jgi:hypothetical protein
MTSEARHSRSADEALAHFGPSDRPVVVDTPMTTELGCTAGPIEDASADRARRSGATGPVRARPRPSDPGDHRATAWTGAAAPRRPAPNCS